MSGDPGILGIKIIERRKYDERDNWGEWTNAHQLNRFLFITKYCKRRFY